MPHLHPLLKVCVDLLELFFSLTFTDTMRRFTALLYFPIPHGLQLSVSSFPSSQAASSYSLGSVGLVNGSLSYLYSSLPLARTSRSRDIDLRYVVEGYRHIPELKVPGQRWQRDMLARAATGRKGTFTHHLSPRGIPVKSAWHRRRPGT